MTPYDGPSSEDISTSRRLAMQLIGQGTDASPVGHWTQALARALQGGVGGLHQDRARAGEQQMQRHLTDSVRSGKYDIPSLISNPMARPFAFQLAQQQAAQNSPMARAQLTQLQQQTAQSAALHPLQLAQLRQQAAHGAAMHPLQQAQLQLQNRAAQRDLDEPRLNQTIVPPGGALVVRDPRTAQSQVIHTQPKEQDAATKRAIWEAQDELPSLKSTLEALEEASTLNPNVYSGYTAGARGALGAKAPDLMVPDFIASPEFGKATARYGQIMNQEAIAKMSAALKGATTDREMARFLSDIADTSLPPSVRQQSIDQLRKLAIRQFRLKEARIRELGGKLPDMTTPIASPQTGDSGGGGAVFDWSPDGGLKPRGGGR